MPAVSSLHEPAPAPTDTPWWRRAAEPAFMVLVAAGPILATAGRALSTWRPVGDNAIIALRASDVFSSHTPLLGMPTTLSRTAGQVLYHPGPIEFWVIAGGQLVSGHRLVPMVMVVTVNLLAVTAIVVMAGWLGGRSGRILAAALVLACTWSLRGDFLIEPYNPYAAWVPLGAFAVALVALVCGRWWALPIAVGFGTYAAQSHVSLLAPVGLCMVATALVGLLAALDHHGGAAGVWRSTRDRLGTIRGPLAAAAGVAAVTWAPVLVDLVGGTRNLLGLTSATSNGPVVGLSDAWQATARGLTSPPWLESNRIGFETLAPASGLRQLAAVVLLAAGAAVAAFLWRRRHPSLWATVVAVAGLAGGTLAASRMPGGTLAAYTLYNYLWLWVFSALFWAGLMSGVVAATGASERVREQVGPAGLHLVPGLAVAALVVGSLVASLSAPVRPSVLAGRHAAAVAAVVAQLPSSIHHGERVLVDIEDDLDQSAVAMALVRELEIRGVATLVGPELEASFRSHRVARSPADWDTRLVVVVQRWGPPGPPEPGLELIATHAPPTDRSVEWSQATAQVEARVRDAGGLMLLFADERLALDESVELVRRGDLVGLGQLGLIADPLLSHEEFDRYAAAQEGPILHVHVYRTDRAAPERISP